jgi:hypothetical protein
MLRGSGDWPPMTELKNWIGGGRRRGEIQCRVSPELDLSLQPTALGARLDQSFLRMKTDATPEAPNILAG